MVDVRFPIIVGTFIILFSFGAVWLGVGSPKTQFPDGYNAFDVVSMVGGYIGGGQANPPSYQQSSYLGYIQAVLPPLIVGNPELDAALLAVPLAVVLGAYSIVRWRFALAAGVLGVAGGALWIGGIYSIAPAAEMRLEAWPGSGGTTSVAPSLGPYVAVTGGLFLLFAYFMTRTGRLDVPLDSTPPASGPS